MFDQAKLGSSDAEPRPEPELRPQPGASRVRLAQLAAQVTGEESGPPDPAPAQPGKAGRFVERWLPPGVAGASAGRQRRIALITAVAGIVLAIGLTVFVLGGRPEAEQPPPLPVARAESASGAPATSSAAAEPLVVSVVGKVEEPGLITVPAGSRVADAVKAAGGPQPGADLLSVNLARRLVDGEQLYIGIPVPPGMQTPAPGPAAGAPGTAPGGTASPMVDLNTADQEQLESLDGIGEVTAQRILEWRAEHGRFTAVEQLRDVDGIGEKRFEQLREQVRIG
ncbi:helix-hairpin-helix domain-containing protein [Prauserella flavalba]|uniref:helix-hairpin-helix domain-containing protein n=1 Tax=Prauserella flavalba TaxID=1477506 RepID=UPI0036EB8C1A